MQLPIFDVKRRKSLWKLVLRLTKLQNTVRRERDRVTFMTGKLIESFNQVRQLRTSVSVYFNIFMFTPAIDVIYKVVDNRDQLWNNLAATG